MSQSYRPIACSLHDELEALATMRRACAITFRDENDQVRTLTEVLADIFARGQEEFVRLSNGTIIRLDQIVSVNEKQFQTPCDLN